MRTWSRSKTNAFVGVEGPEPASLRNVDPMTAKIFDVIGERIYIAGHRGMVGSAIARRLGAYGCDVITAGREEVDLERQEQTERFLIAARPDVVVIAAAKVGGIQANRMYPAEFIANNLAIALNVIQGSYRAGVKKLLFLGSSCVYPKFARQPMGEEDLLSGPLEPTNEWYAIAKIAGIKLCQAFRRQYGADFISLMPTNLYGPGDNYHADHSHVLPALIRRVHQAKQDGAPTVMVWGTGTPHREFLFVDDLADACVFVLEHYAGESHLNVGSGEEVTIADAAQLIAEVIDYRGNFAFDTSRPDGAPRKLLDSSKLIEMGWRPRTSLREGLKLTYSEFIARFPKGC
jgi:GDP-L-fucose synthase